MEDDPTKRRICNVNVIYIRGSDNSRHLWSEMHASSGDLYIKQRRLEELKVLFGDVLPREIFFIYLPQREKEKN